MPVFQFFSSHCAQKRPWSRVLCCHSIRYKIPRETSQAWIYSYLFQNMWFSCQTCENTDCCIHLFLSRPPTPHFYWSVLASCCSICCHPLLEGLDVFPGCLSASSALHITLFPTFHPRLKAGSGLVACLKLSTHKVARPWAQNRGDFFLRRKKKEKNLIFP